MKSSPFNSKRRLSLEKLEDKLPLAGDDPVSMVSDLTAGETDTTFLRYQEFDDDLLFLKQDDGSRDYELWKTDGTAGGTTLLKEFTWTSSNDTVQGFRRLGNQVVFSTTTKLWATDGTAAGTIEITPEPYKSRGFGFGVWNLSEQFQGHLYFHRTSEDEIWRTDGTAAGTVLFKEVVTNTSDRDHFLETTVLNDQLLFTWRNAERAKELWRTDGTSEGTYRIFDKADMQNQRFAVSGNLAYYMHLESISSGGLFSVVVTDGTVENTKTVVESKDINSRLTSFNNQVFFGIQESRHVPDRLWVSNGEAAGTSKIFDYGPFLNSSELATNEYFYYTGYTFFGGSGTSPRDQRVAIYRSDGTAVGTEVFKDFETNALNTFMNFTPVGDTEFIFKGSLPDVGMELFVSDGTPENTKLLKDINPGAGSAFSPGGFIKVGNKYFFTADDGVHGRELWVVDSDQIDFSQPPTLDALPDLTIDEDDPQQVVNLAGITDGDEGLQPLAVTATSNNTALIPNPSVTYTSPNATGSLAFTPIGHQHGTAIITVKVEDGGQDNNLATPEDNLTFTRTFEVTVNSTNDAPTLNAIADVTIDEDDPQQVVNLAGITDGDEGLQPLAVTATSNNTALIPNPSVTYTSPNETGSISFTPVGDQHGTAIITVTIEDGGQDNNLATPEDNLTFSRTFEVTVNSANDAPTLDAIADLRIDEDDPQQVVNLAGITDGDEGLQPLAVTATSNNTALIPNPSVSYTSPNETGSISFTPVGDQHGTAIITVTVEDGGQDNNLATSEDNLTFTRTFEVTVNSANDAPTLYSLSDLTIDEDDPQQVVDLAGITDGDEGLQPLAVTATSNNTALIPNPSVSYTSPNATGSISFTPVGDQHGTAIITVTVEDGGQDNNLATPEDNLTFSRTFEVTVNSANDAPTLDAIADLTIDEDGPQQVVNLAGITDGDEGLQPLAVTATSNNTSLIPNPSVTYTSPNETGSISFTPVGDQYGTAIITVTVEDGGQDNNLATPEDNLTFSRTFGVTVNPLNDLPTVDAPDELDFSGSATDHQVNLTNITAGPNESSQPIVVSISTDNPAFLTEIDLDYSGGTTGTLTFSTLAGELGRGNLYITIEDGGLDNDLSTKEDNATLVHAIDVAVTAKKRSYVLTDHTVFGEIEGTYRDTYWKNQYSQSIQETLFRAYKRSRLEHHWEIELAGADVSLEFFVDASHDATNEQFRFQYQVEGSSQWKTLVTTTQNAGKRYYARFVDPDLANDVTIKVRVVDTDRQDDAERAKITVDRMFFLSRRLTTMDDAVNVLVFDPEADEAGNNKAQFRFQLADRNRLDHDVEVFYEVSGTADNSDYREVLRGSKIIKAGNLMSRLFITPQGDNEFEGAESVTVKILGSSEYRLTGDPVATVKIMDDELITREAFGEVTNYGSHKVNYTQGWYQEGQRERLTEEIYAAGNRTRLDHRWKFDLTGQEQVLLKGRFKITSEADQDDFQIVYSIDGQNTWQSLGRVTSADGFINLSKSITLPEEVSEVWVRVFDRYRRNGDTTQTTLAVDYIRFEKFQSVAAPFEPLMALQSSQPVRSMAFVAPTNDPGIFELLDTDSNLLSDNEDDWTQQDEDEFFSKLAEEDSTVETWGRHQPNQLELI